MATRRSSTLWCIDSRYAAVFCPRSAERRDDDCSRHAAEFADPAFWPMDTE